MRTFFLILFLLIVVPITALLFISSTPVVTLPHGIATTDPNWAAQFRSQYNGHEGADMPIVVRRGGQDVALSSKVMLATVVNERIDFDPAASPRAVRIRDGIVKGRA